MKFFLLSIFLTAPLFASKPEMTMTVSLPVIGTNETTDITIEVVNTKLTEPPIPSEESDDYVISYTGSSTGNSVTIINGVINSQSMLYFRYQFVPKKTGTFKLPAFVGKTEQGKTIYSSTQKVTVEEIGSVNSGGFNVFNPFTVFDNGPGEAFVLWEVQTNNIIQNTGFLANLYIYTDNPRYLNQLDNPDNMQILERASFKGGILYDLPFDETNTKTEYLGNRMFYGRLYKQFAAYPLDKGTLQLIPAQLIDISGSFPYHFPGEAMAIESIGLSGALSYIGNTLSIESSLSGDNVSARTELQFTLTVSGSGNTDFFADPLQNTDIDGLFISDPQTEIRIKLVYEETITNINMIKTFTYTLVPQKAGTYTIPPITLSYKNKQGVPQTSISENLTFTALADTISKKDSSLKEISTPKQTLYFSSGIGVILVGLIAGLLIMLVGRILSVRQQRLEYDEDFARISNADKKLKKILSESEQAVKEKKYKDAARLLRQSVLSYCADKFSLAPSSSPKDILSYFEQKGYQFEHTKLFSDLMNSLEFYAFGTPPSAIQIQNYFDEAFFILQAISKIRKTS